MNLEENQYLLHSLVRGINAVRNYSNDKINVPVNVSSKLFKLVECFRGTSMYVFLLCSTSKQTRNINASGNCSNEKIIVPVEIIVPSILFMSF